MKYLPLLILFLILLLPFTVDAASTNNTKKTELSKEYTDRLKQYDNEQLAKEKQSDDDPDDAKEKETEETEVTESTVKITDSGMVAGQAMITNSGKEMFYWVGDEFLKGGFKISSVGVEEKKVTENNTMTYSLYSKELKPLSNPSVRRTVFLTYLFHIGVCICVIFLGVCRYNAQKISPKKTTKIMAGFTGEYTQFDIVCFIILCSGVILMPLVDWFGIWYCLLMRNGMASFMTSKTLDILGATTDSLPTYLLVNAAWYTTNLEKVFGEYAINTMCRLIVVKSWVQAAIVLAGSLTKAAVIQAVVMTGFVLVLSMDIITLFFVSSGIDDSVTSGNWGHTFAGMGYAVVFDAAILIGLVLIPISITYYKITRGRIGGHI